MAGLTAAGLYRDGVLRVIAALYPDPVGAQALLQGLGAELSRLPHFAGAQVPLNSWFQACLTIENGAFAFTLEDLVAAAHRDFPNNSVLSAVVNEAQRPPSGRLEGAPPDELTVLCLLAGPREASQLQLRREFRTIEEAARRGRRRTLRVELSAATRRHDILPALSEHRPDIVHFAGHGSPNGYLLLEEDDGRVAPVSAEGLAGVLKSAGGVSVAVLNACHLGRYLDVISPHAREVIGSAERLPDRDALAFSQGYYSALALGESWQRAFDSGVATIGLGPGGTPDLRRVVSAG
ncbi:effector-associated domain EAD1-containing protein [Streptomyces sp. NPDC096205]|uniref:effector-associated domain EAD1-containing protein n=1 Tax=Streptomyces sp. NPDC096205 TaxID=3366081 RepID=UPI003801E5AC